MPGSAAGGGAGTRGGARRFVVLAIAIVHLSACGDEPIAIVEPPPEDPDPCSSHPIALQVGETEGPRTLGAGCILPVPGAEYALAVLDPRRIQYARETGEEEFLPYLVSVTLGESAAAAPGTVREARPDGDATAPCLVELQAEPHQHLPFDRATPWVLGEEFSLYDSQDARIVRIYEDGLVVAWMDDLEPELMGRFLAQLDTAVGHVRSTTLPFLREAFVPRLPVTSTGSGQYLIVLMDLLPYARGVAPSTARGDAMLTYIILHMDAEWGTTRLASLLAHEMTHSYQIMYMHDTRPAGTVRPGLGPFWGLEGGANLISYELVRRMAGIGLDANYDWRNPHDSPAAGFYALRAQPGTGDFNAGYDNSMGFLRDLVIRRVRSGEPLEEALKAVSRGAVEGWFGIDRSGGQRPGLTERMQARLGGWQPDHAMLDWTLSHAADDRTDNARFQDHASLRVWDLPADHPVGWHPAAVLSARNPSVTIERRSGNPEYLHLHDDGEGLTFTVSSDVPVQWKLIRTR
jgi:hypothetical protein